MKLSIKMDASRTQNNETIDIEDDLGITESEWAEMSEDEKKEKLIEYCVDLNEQPYWAYDKHETIDPC